MRLINTLTCEFEEFIGRNIPPYAILSHTWEEEEVSFQDYEAGNYSHKKGYGKIKMTLEIARMSELRYAWVDACCIDKKSSAELTEAINSMYRWYERSIICYVYLSDLESGANAYKQLAKCRWFTRGWTLQELIAPLNMQFFDSHWNYVGTKSQLCSGLSSITRISKAVLSHECSLSSVCVAQKMSWAASRQTTRIEDIAYSLLGIFGVNMPLLYGEEENAFRRLQEEIIKIRSDLSILAWMDHRSKFDFPGSRRLYCGFLARTPAPFLQCGDMFKSISETPLEDFTITNRGIRVSCTIEIHEDPLSKFGHYILPLPYHSGNGSCLALRLRKIGDEMFLREDPASLFKYKKIFHVYTLKLRYLAVDLPKRWDLNLPMRPVMDQEYLRRFRRSVLQLDIPAPVTLLDYQGAYDVEDQIFLSESGFSRSSIWLRFGLRLDIVGKTTEMHGYDVECILFVLGWGDIFNKSLRYALVDCKAYSSQVAAVQAGFANWEYDL